MRTIDKLICVIANMVQDLHDANTARLCFDTSSDKAFKERESEYLEKTGIAHQNLKEVTEMVKDALRRLFKEASAAGLYETPRYKFAMAQLDPSKLFEVSSRSVKRAEIWSKNYPVYGRLLDFVLGDKKLQDYSKQWDKVANFAKEQGVQAKPMPTLQEYLDARIPKTAELSLGSVKVLEAEGICLEE